MSGFAEADGQGQQAKSGDKRGHQNGDEAFARPVQGRLKIPIATFGAGQMLVVRNEKRGTGWRTAAELETQNPKPETELTARAGPLSDPAGVTVEQAPAA